MTSVVTVFVVHGVVGDVAQPGPVQSAVLEIAADPFVTSTWNEKLAVPPFGATEGLVQLIFEPATVTPLDTDGPRREVPVGTLSVTLTVPAALPLFVAVIV